jgi:hypothetical protein
MAVGAAAASERPYVMRRRLFNIAAVLSVVASLAMLLLFGLGKSWFVLGDHGRHRLVGNWYYSANDSGYVGRIGVYHDWPTPNVSPPLTPNLGYTPQALAWYDRQPTGSHLRKFGFAYDHDTYFERNWTPSLIAMGRYVQVGVPFWAAWVVWLTPIPFAVVFGRRVVTEGRIKRGQCVACGYDLRATPERCPECGAVPNPPHHPPTQRTATASSGAVK